MLAGLQRNRGQLRIGCTCRSGIFSYRSGLSLPLKLDGYKIARWDKERNIRSFPPVFGFYNQPGEHVEIAIHHAIGYGVNSPPAHMPRLQLWSVWGSHLVTHCLILSLDDVYRFPRV